MKLDGKYSQIILLSENNFLMKIFSDDIIIIKKYQYY